MFVGASMGEGSTIYNFFVQLVRYKYDWHCTFQKHAYSKYIKYNTCNTTESDTYTVRLIA